MVNIEVKDFQDFLVYSVDDNGAGILEQEINT